MKIRTSLVCGLLVIMFSACNSTRPKTESENTINLDEEKIEVVGKNERGVLFRRFANGIDTSKVYLPGEYKVKTYDRFIKYNIDSISEINFFESKTKLGRTITFKLNYSYKLIPEKVALMEYYIGSDYHEIIVKKRIQNSIDELVLESNEDFENKVQTNALEEALLKLSKKEIEKRYVELLELTIIEILKD